METLRTRVWKSTGIKVALVLSILILLVLGACQNSLGGPAISTWTPLPSATPTCAPNIKLSTPEGWNPSSRLIIILYDPTTAGNQALEFSDGTHASSVYMFVSRIAPELMRAGDQVSIFQIGYKEYVDARVSRLYSYSTRAQLYNTPSPPEILTPIPTLGTQAVGLLGIAAQNDYDNQAAANAATSTSSAMIYNCQVLLWNGNAELTATALNQVKVQEHATLGSQMTADVSQFQQGALGKKESVSGFELYDALQEAKLDLSTDCKSYDQCILLIVDDLLPLATPRPDYLQIDLQGAVPYVIMPNCKDLHQPSCTTLQNIWDGEFQRFNAGKATYFNGLRVETNLLNALGR